MKITTNSYNYLRDSFSDFSEILHKSILSPYIATKYCYELDSEIISLSYKYKYLLSNTDKSYLIEKNNITNDYK